MPAPVVQEKPAQHRWDSGRPRLAMAVSGGIHALALMGFLFFNVFAPKKEAVVPIFEMVSLEPPKLRPLKPKSPEPPPPEKVEARKPDAPKLTSKPEKTLAVTKPDPKTPRQDQDTTAPIKEAPDQTAEPTTTITTNIPADPRLSIWAGRVKKLVERNWNPPGGIETNGVVKATVSFNVAREGTVSDIVLSQGSGIAMIDEMAQQAVQRVESLPPIPENFPNDVLQVAFEFKYSGQ